MKDVVLAVPNISEGRDAETVARIAGTKALLDISSDPDHNRSVLTYGGKPDAVLEAVLRMAEHAIDLLDISSHTGAHPRFGVVDILPFVVDDAILQAVLPSIEVLIQRIEGVLAVPVLRYGRLSPDERSLPALRHALREELPVPHPTAGLMCVGVRDPLIAFNVNCIGSLRAARAAAREVRRVPGIRALGFELPSRGEVQISMNLIDIDRTGPALAYEAARDIALRHGLRVIDAEVVGLIPERLHAQLRPTPLRWPVRTIEGQLRLGSI